MLIPKGVPLIVNTEIVLSEATKISPVIQQARKSTILSCRVSTRRIREKSERSQIIILPIEHPETRTPYSGMDRKTSTGEP